VGYGDAFRRPHAPQRDTAEPSNETTFALTSERATWVAVSRGGLRTGVRARRRGDEAAIRLYSTIEAMCASAGGAIDGVGAHEVTSAGRGRRAGTNVLSMSLRRERSAARARRRGEREVSRVVGFDDVDDVSAHDGKVAPTASR
jgi:hypothetical protein